MFIRHLSVTKGNDQTYNLTFKDDNQQPICLKDWTIYFTAKSNYSLPDSQASLQKVVTSFPDTISGTSGSASITILKTDTLNMEVGVYDYDITVKTNDGSVYTVMKGKFELEYRVTDTASTAGTSGT